MKTDLLTLFEKTLKSDRELAKRYPHDLFYRALAKNTEQCLELIKRSRINYN